MNYTVTKSILDNIDMITDSTIIYDGNDMMKAVSVMDNITKDTIKSDIDTASGNDRCVKVSNAWHCGDSEHPANIDRIDTITAEVVTIDGEHALLTLKRDYTDDEYADRVASIKDIMRQAYMDAGFTMQEANDRIDSDGGNTYIWYSLYQYQDLDDIACEMAGFAREEFENL